MSFEPTPTQALLLFGLLACHGECAQAVVMPAVNKGDREALQKAGLIAVSKQGRGLYLKLEDGGWDWADKNLDAALPPAHWALNEILGRLGEHLAEKQETLADFIGAKPETKSGAKLPRKRAESKVAQPTVSKSNARSKSKAVNAKADSAKGGKLKPAKPRSPSVIALRKRIEMAYLSLTNGRKNESVRLASLRNALQDLDRRTVDAALGRILKGDKKASLLRHDDPDQLGSADHAAAFNPAGEPFHVIWIAS